MDPFIVTLTSITQPEITLLADAGITNGEDLSVITFHDLTPILPNASIVKRRRLSAIAEYLARQQEIDAATTMSFITNYVRAPVAPVIHPSFPPRPPDPSRGALRLPVNALEKYSGSPIDFEDWKLKTIATLGQTTYSQLLDSAPPAGDVILEARNKELYNMFVTAFLKGTLCQLSREVLGFSV